jgi:hypothetical protein
VRPEVLGKLEKCTSTGRDPALHENLIVDLAVKFSSHFSVHKSLCKFNPFNPVLVFKIHFNIISRPTIRQPGMSSDLVLPECSSTTLQLQHCITELPHRYVLYGCVLERKLNNGS